MIKGKVDGQFEFSGIIIQMKLIYLRIVSDTHFHILKGTISLIKRK